MATHSEIRELVDSVLGRNPAPWHVGPRNSTRSMFPIRDANGRVVMYAYNERIAELIVDLIEHAP